MISIIITIAIVGVILWAIDTYLPMQPMVKGILNVVVIVCLLIWLLRILG